MPLVSFLQKEEQRSFSVIILPNQFREIMTMIEKEEIHLISCISTKHLESQKLEITIRCNSEKAFNSVKDKLYKNNFLTAE